jgi:inhibitor of cysteine peptidase
MERKYMALAVMLLVLGVAAPIILNLFWSTSPANLQSPKIQPKTATTQSLLEFYPIGANSFQSIEEILRFVEERTSSKGYMGPPYYLVRGETQTIPATTATATPEGAPQSPSTPSKTNVQVVGVDEPDIVKAEDGILAVASGSKVNVVGMREKRVVSVIDLAEGNIYGIYLQGDRLVVISVYYTASPIRIQGSMGPEVPISAGISNTSICVYSLSTPVKPELLYSTYIYGMPMGSRLLNNKIYLVATLPLEVKLPVIDGQPLPPSSIAKIDPYANSYIVIVAMDIDTGKRTAFAFTSSPSTWIYMSRERLYLAVQRNIGEDSYIYFLNASLNYLPTEVKANISSLISKGQYVQALSELQKYLATLSYEKAEEIVKKVMQQLRPMTDKTYFYVFSIDGLRVASLGRFEVDGGVLDQFSMEEMGDNFIVATTISRWQVYAQMGRVVGIVYRPYNTTMKIEIQTDGKTTIQIVKFNETPITPVPSTHLVVYPVRVEEPENNLYIVDVQNLRIKGSLTGLAKGERIYSARLVGKTFYLVTYRQVDPLFAIDVSDPSKPRVLGYVKAPGFSEYIHPIDDKTLLGVGLADDRKLKITLFDVSDPTNIKETSTVTLDAWSNILSDHHAFTFDPATREVFVPIQSWKASSGGILVLKISGDSLEFVKLLEHTRAIRTVYTQTELYTVSTGQVRAYNRQGYTLTAKIDMPSG